jgi:hypothetical protein
VNKGKGKAIEKRSSTPELEDELLSQETGHDDVPSPQGAVRDHIDLRMGNRPKYPLTTPSKRLGARKRQSLAKGRAPDLPLPLPPTVDAHEDRGGISDSIQFMSALEPGKVTREGVKIQMFGIDESRPPLEYEFLASEATVSDYYTTLECFDNN